MSIRRTTLQCIQINVMIKSWVHFSFRVINKHTMRYYHVLSRWWCCCCRFCCCCHCNWNYQTIRATTFFLLATLDSGEWRSKAMLLWTLFNVCGHKSISSRINHTSNALVGHHGLAHVCCFHVMCLPYFKPHCWAVQLLITLGEHRSHIWPSLTCARAFYYLLFVALPNALAHHYFIHF